MSARSISLKSPVTIVVVVALLGAVTALNIKTFGGRFGRPDSTRSYRMQAHPPVPSDVRQLVVHEADLARSQIPRDTKLRVASLDRDPFFPPQKQPRPVVMPVARPSVKKKVVQKPENPLECSAIMLGGQRPMAIINGEGRHPGDTIRGMTLTGIDADGVTLKKSDGTLSRLPVGVMENSEDRYRLVTRTRKNNDQGRTSLVDQ